MINRKKRVIAVALVCILLTILGIVVYSACRKRHAESAVQMFSFNEDLVKKENNDKCRTTYEIFVYSFCDSDGDGMGDINGIRSKLDYIEEMGFDQIWLTPVHPSPTYHKYDVSDYYEIDPAFGTLEDYEALLKECHQRGITVLMDMVLNHTSVSNSWFKYASDYLHELPSDWAPDIGYCKYFDYYNFSREQRDGFAPLEGTNWFYEARFWSGMPDLNLDSEFVRSEVESIASYWLGKGVDGFRLDAVTSYYTGVSQSNADFIRWFCNMCRAISPDCYIVGEAWTDKNSIAALYSSGIDSLFNFPFSGNEGIIRNTVGGFIKASDFVYAMMSSDDAYRAQNPDYVDAPFYTNHDIARSAGYYTLDEGPETKMAYGLSLLMSGNSFVYYGEEIGMKGSGKDENKRAPMYWSDDSAYPGICAGPPDMDDVTMKFEPVDKQKQDDLSLLNWFKQVIKVRQAFPSIRSGRVSAAEGVNSDVIAAFYKETAGEEPVLIVINLSHEVQNCDLNDSLAKEFDLVAVLNTSEEDILFKDGELQIPAFSIAVLTY